MRQQDFILQVLILIFSSSSLQAKNPPCALQDTVEIERFKILPNNSLLDTDSKIHYPPELYFKTTDSTYRGCVCELKKCIRKCCPADQHFLNGSAVCDQRGPSWKNFSTSVFRKLMHSSSPDKMIAKADFAFLLGFQKCDHGSYMLEFEKNPDDNFTLLDSGKLQLLMDTPPDPIDISQYCIDYFEGEHAVCLFSTSIFNTISEPRKALPNA
jgi:Methuselah N-terminus